MRTYNLREATEKDLPEILAIFNFHIEHTTVIYHYHKRSIAEMQAWFQEKKQSNFPILVAEENGKILGYGTYGKFRPHDAYQFCVEHSVYVNPKQQGKGIGKQLILQLISIAKRGNFHTMIAGIDAENKFSVEFHQKLGFKQVGYLKQVGFKFNRWLDLVFLQFDL